MNKIAELITDMFLGMIRALIKISCANSREVYNCLYSLEDIVEALENPLENEGEKRIKEMINLAIKYKDKLFILADVTYQCHEVPLKEFLNQFIKLCSADQFNTCVLMKEFYYENDYCQYIGWGKDD